MSVAACNQPFFLTLIARSCRVLRANRGGCVLPAAGASSHVPPGHRLFTQNVPESTGTFQIFRDAWTA